MSSTKPADFPLLLEVFRDGLILGLISKAHVVAWADGIISKEVEPDYFFIEVSLSRNLNGLIEILNPYVTSTDSPIPPRVIYTLIYDGLTDDTHAVELAVSLIARTPFRGILTPLEDGIIYGFEDAEFLYGPDSTQLQVDVLNFLSFYKDFSLDNFEQWPEINDRVEEALKEEQVKVDVVNESFKKVWEKKQRKRKLKRYAIRSIPILVGITILITDYVSWDKGHSETFFNHIMSDLYFLNIFGAYFIIRFYYKWWRNKRRMR